MRLGCVQQPAAGRVGDSVGCEELGSDSCYICKRRSVEKIGEVEKIGKVVSDVEQSSCGGSGRETLGFNLNNHCKSKMKCAFL